MLGKEKKRKGKGKDGDNEVELGAISRFAERAADYVRD